jgi:hypothetical protein
MKRVSIVPDWILMWKCILYWTKVEIEMLAMLYDPSVPMVTDLGIATMVRWLETETSSVALRGQVCANNGAVSGVKGFASFTVYYLL